MKIINESFKLDKNLTTGTNTISILNSKINTKYNVFMIYNLKLFKFNLLIV